jgi:broad specificity phosphatase PhoE
MSEPVAPTPAPGAHRLLLLRHGEVTSHRGDVPVTAAGLATATARGTQLGASGTRRVRVLGANTLRARQTAEAVADGARRAGAVVDGPTECFALRNPDLYLAGVRVDMVSTAAAFAEQVPGLAEEVAAASPFVSGFLSAADRIGWWLRHPDPPGDDATCVQRRITGFARSLADLGDGAPAVTVAVTHSPVIRACALPVLGDPGEPDWVAGLEMLVTPDREVRISWLRAPAVV